jgi:hypothetical protein
MECTAGHISAIVLDVSDSIQAKSSCNEISQRKYNQNYRDRRVEYHRVVLNLNGEAMV